MNSKQTLEEITKTLEVVDESVHRKYERIVKINEDAGIKRNYLALASSLFALTSLPLYGAIEAIKLSKENPLDASFTGLAILTALETAVGATQKLIRKEETTDAKVDSRPNYVRTWDEVSKKIRLPFLGVGLGLVTKAGLGILNYSESKDLHSALNIVSDLSLGATLIGNASSMYIRDSDPKLLDKVPALKRVYSALKDKVSSLLPSPEPNPRLVPVKAKYGVKK